jgi:hypothetical protein
MHGISLQWENLRITSSPVLPERDRATVGLPLSQFIAQFFSSVVSLLAAAQPTNARRYSDESAIIWSEACSMADLPGAAGQKIEFDFAGKPNVIHCIEKGI